ncbi:hypothetical protein BgiMline_030500, partial [Biomphalaria glabrata]
TNVNSNNVKFRWSSTNSSVELGIRQHIYPWQSAIKEIKYLSLDGVPGSDAELDMYNDDNDSGMFLCQK